MTRFSVFLLAVILTHGARSQETVVWAAEVLDVSSEFGPLEYSALQALHKPNVLPGGGQNPNSWRPKRPDKYEFITVAFDTPIVAKQVAIAESENPGAVSAVYAYDEDFTEYVLFELSPTQLPIESRLLNLFFEETTYKIKALRIETNGDQVAGHNSIDAVGISAANIPISVLIRIAKGINQEIPSERLSANVNSSYVDHGPIISPDGNRLYFSRQYHPENMGGTDDPEDIWVSEFDESTGDWAPAKNIGSPLNNEGPNFISSIAMIGDEEVFILGNRYGKKGRMFVGASRATYKNGEFSEPTPLEIENEYNYDRRTDFFLAPGGEVLLISAERDETYGRRDIYVSFKEDEKWTEPKNLGGMINTISMEAAPFLSEDGKTLYFSSAGQTGYGLLDIYVSTRLDDTWLNWSEPQNLGAAINTKFDDQYFSIPNSGRHMFFTRGDVNENTDIFRFQAKDFLVSDDSPLMSSIRHLVPEEETPLLVVTGSVKDAKSGELLGNTIINIQRLPDGVILDEVKTDENGAYSFEIPAGIRFSISAEKEGFVAQSERIDPNQTRSLESVGVDLVLQPVEVGRAVALNNIFFEFGQHVLTMSSFPELDRIVQLLKDGDINRIQIAGFTDSVGKESYNQGLSERRARSVSTYFLRKGIDADRIKSIGYGEKNPIATNDTEEGRERNRRVEFQILEVN
ncbi:MAG: OmpA family protein [Bacteroidota bacterium]